MFLGFHITLDTEKRVTVVTQENYIRGAVVRYNITKTSAIPMELSFEMNLTDIPAPEDVDPDVKEKFGSVVGTMIYARRWCWPHFLYPINTLARLLHVPVLRATYMGRRVLRAKDA